MSRALVIGLDGASYAVLDPLMESGLMPVLAGFVRRGTRATLLSTPNPLTPSAWTSLATGRSPGEHGIFDFVRVEEFTYHPHFRLATSSDIHARTIWSLMGDHGRQAICLNYPVMFPPQPLPGFMIPGFVPHRHLRQASYPKGFYERLKTIPGLDLSEITVDFEEERRSVQVLEPGEYEDWVRFHIRRERHWFRILAHLMDEEPWDLASVIFDGVDKLQHICWRFLDPRIWAEEEASDWERRVRGLCLDYFRELDDLIGGLLERVEEDDQVFVVSDHGFGPSDEIFYVNTWLAENGYLKWREDAPLAREGMLNTEGMKTPAFLFDWSGTRAYALTPGSNGIYLYLDGRDGDEAGRAEERESLVRELTAALREVRNPETGEPVVRRVMRREDVFPGAWSHLAPDLTLVLRDHGFISVLRSDVAVKSRREVVGAHRPEGVLMAAGRGIRQGAVVGELSILDVTPTLLAALDLPVPVEYEGRLAEELYLPDQLPRKRVSWARESPVESAVPGAAEDLLPAMDASSEAIVLERLKALGYLE